MRTQILALALALAAVSPSPASAGNALSFSAECTEQGVELSVWVLESAPWVDAWTGARFLRRELGTETWTDVGPAFLPRNPGENVVTYLDTEADPDAMYEYAGVEITADGNPLDPPIDTCLVVRPYVRCNGPMLLGMGEVEVLNAATGLVRWTEACATIPWTLGWPEFRVDCSMAGGVRTGDVIAVYGETFFECDYWPTTIDVCVPTSCPNVALFRESFGMVKSRY